jgi:hypothetical protein
MKRFRALAIALTLVQSLPAHPRDAQSVFDLLKKGTGLSPQEADKLEERLKKKPDDEQTRIQLLSYYAGPPTGADLPMVKAARLRHILWLISNDPKDGLGLFQVATGVYRLHCQGDVLADPEAFKHASEIWSDQLKKSPGNTAIRREAVDFIQYCSPEDAEQILIEGRDQLGLARLYAAAVLGITGQSYLNNDPAGSDPARRQTRFAEKAQLLLEKATDRDILVGAATGLLRDGAILWADGKLDWDYTPLGNSLLARALDAAPDSMTLLTLPTTLPARGERPPLTIRVGGNVQSANLVRKITPPYPPMARDMGIQGIVQMTALIGLDGKVLYLHPDSGPRELIPASVGAVRQWEYRPTMLNGKPCYVITRIDVNYTLSQF